MISICCVDFASLDVVCDELNECAWNVCLNFGGVYGVGICVNVCGVVCFVVCWYVVCFFRLDVVCCGVVGVWGVVIFVLSVMRVVGGVPLWVECVFRRVVC